MEQDKAKTLEREEVGCGPETLKFYQELRQDLPEGESIVSVSKISDFKVDKDKKENDKFQLGDVYFVVKEVEGEDGKKTTLYDIYSMSGDKIGETDMNNRLQLHGKDSGKQILTMIKEDRDSGKLKDRIIVANANTKKTKNQAKDIADDNDENAENGVSEKVGKKDLSKEQLKEKAEEQGIDLNIDEMRVIDDPTFYRVVPDAKILTYMFKDKDGKYGFIDSRGHILESIVDDGVRGQRTDVETGEEMNIIANFRVGSGASGLRLPLLKEGNKANLHIEDITDKDNMVVSISMAGQQTSIDEKKSAEKVSIGKEDEVVVGEEDFRVQIILDVANANHIKITELEAEEILVNTDLCKSDFKGPSIRNTVAEELENYENQRDGYQRQLGRSDTTDSE